MAAGPYLVRDATIPSTIDTQVLEQARMADGTTYRQVLQMFISALVGYNGEVPQGQGDTGSLVGAVSATGEQRIDVRQGSFSTSEHNELVLPNPQRKTLTGWMVPSTMFDGPSLSWSWEGLAVKRREDVEADIADLFDAMRARMMTEMLQRIFTKATEAVDGGAGTGVGVGFVQAEADPLSYVPPPFMDRTFLSTHDHFGPSGTSTSAQLYTELVAGRRDLNEHGYRSTRAQPWVLLHGPDDRTIVEGATDGTTVQYMSRDDWFKNAALTSESLADITPWPFAHGAIKGTGCLCAELASIPQYYYAMLPLGQNARAKPLRRFGRKEYGDGLAMALGLQPGTQGADLINSLGVVQDIGFGVQVREAAYVIYLGNATWADASI